MFRERTIRHIGQRGAIIKRPELVNESLTRQQTPSALTELCDDKKGKKRICRGKLVSARKSPEKGSRTRTLSVAIPIYSPAEKLRVDIGD